MHSRLNSAATPPIASSSSSASSSRSSAASTPRPLSPPLLTLNGSPIAPPSSSAYPPVSPARKRRASSSHSNRMAGQKLDPAGRHQRQSSAQARQAAAAARARNSQRKTAAKNAAPNPILHPIAFVSWVRWRIDIWLLGHLAGEMLTDVEIFLLCKWARRPQVHPRRAALTFVSFRARPSQSSSPSSSPASYSTRSCSTFPTAFMRCWDERRTTSLVAKERLEVWEAREVVWELLRRHWGVGGLLARRSCEKRYSDAELASRRRRHDRSQRAAARHCRRSEHTVAPSASTHTRAGRDEVMAILTAPGAARPCCDAATDLA
ncbi:hypothetical protein BDZ90DRAFT_187807 [Jaminaea rosea]|uniref:Uncharacterized protein n=1 Tax=Jaminaea rosea TaxID=1569628 RepID=A0A316UQX2_9BASI|nr:hypothetical protein BDZ90DRAFT_187807 [Jaminaea rosea]PWN27188.1 hypothetical protein BDZ90DRAFT_187807 [Jaminaea rosea]